MFTYPRVHSRGLSVRLLLASFIKTLYKGTMPPQPAENRLQSTYNLPIRSSFVTSEAGLRLPRQRSEQTWEDLIDAEVRLMNQYIMFGLDPGQQPADILKGITPAFSLSRTMQQASEIARQRLVDEGKMSVDQPVKPLSPGAFYKTIDSQAGPLRHKTSARFFYFQKVVASRLVANAAFPELSPGDYHPDAHLDLPAEFMARVNNPGYIFLGSLAMHSKNPALSDLTKQVQEVMKQEIFRLSILVAKDWYDEQRQPLTGITAMDTSLGIASLLRGRVTRSVRLNRPWLFTEEPADRWGLKNPLAESGRTVQAAGQALLNFLSESAS